MSSEHLTQEEKNAIAKQRAEALFASPHFKGFVRDIEELTAELKDNPEAQMENAKRLW